MEIENGFIKYGKSSIQIANIVSMRIKENTQHARKATALGYVITFCLLLALSKNPPLAIAASPVVALISAYLAFREELWIVTSAGTAFRIASRNKEFLDKLKKVVERSKTKGDSFYTINRFDNSITDNRVQASATTHVGDKITVGDINMTGDTYKAENSPGASVGIGNIAHIEGSAIIIGSSNEQRPRQGASVDALIKLVGASKLNEVDKATAVRQLENVKEEISSSGEPDRSVIAKYLGGFKSLLKNATAGAELYEAAKDVFSAFGITG
jgi:hypothetical protein